MKSDLFFRDPCAIFSTAPTMAQWSLIQKGGRFLMSDVTLKKLSELSGLSIRSVSRALQGKSGLSEENRRKVLSIAREISYTPNIQARNLRLQKNNFVGIVVQDFQRDSIALRKINHLNVLLTRNGYCTLFGINNGKRTELEELLRQWNGMVGSVIFFSWDKSWNAEELSLLCSAQFIFVDQESECGHSLIIDRGSGIYDAITYLLKSSHCSIARCGNIESREQGFNQALPDLNSPEVKHRYFPSQSNFEDGYLVGKKLLEGKFDAVFFDTDRMAFGFLKYCWEHAVKIPDRIAVVGFDDESFDLFSSPSLSTVAHPVEEMSAAILQLVKHPETEYRKLIFKTRFIKRESV